MINRRHILMLGLLAGLFANTWAQVAKAPVYVQQHLTAPRMVGKGNYSVFGFDIYQATLWGSDTGVNPDQWPTQRLALELRYARSFEGRDIAKRSIDEIQALSPLPVLKTQAWLKTLEDLFPNVQKDQTLTGIYIPSGGSHFFFNEKSIGSIQDAELSERFFAIWLSPGTSAKKLRAALFGGS
jgi:hypothetical protein